MEEILTFVDGMGPGTHPPSYLPEVSVFGSDQKGRSLDDCRADVLDIFVHRPLEGIYVKTFLKELVQEFFALTSTQRKKEFLSSHMGIIPMSFLNIVGQSSIFNNRFTVLLYGEDKAIAF